MIRHPMCLIFAVQKLCKFVNRKINEISMLYNNYVCINCVPFTHYISVQDVLYFDSGHS